MYEKIQKLTLTNKTILTKRPKVLPKYINKKLEVTTKKEEFISIKEHKKRFLWPVLSAV